MVWLDTGYRTRVYGQENAGECDTDAGSYRPDAVNLRSLLAGWAAALDCHHRGARTMTNFQPAKSLGSEAPVFTKCGKAGRAARIFGPIKDYECLCGKYTWATSNSRLQLRISGS
jgi:hypothetical protein